MEREGANCQEDCERFAFIIENRVLLERQFSTQCVENLMNWPTACWLIVLSMKRKGSGLAKRQHNGGLEARRRGKSKYKDRKCSDKGQATSTGKTTPIHGRIPITVPGMIC